jgi:hypothetical protein
VERDEAERGELTEVPWDELAKFVERDWQRMAVGPCA